MKDDFNRFRSSLRDCCIGKSLFTNLQLQTFFQILVKITQPTVRIQATFLLKYISALWRVI